MAKFVAVQPYSNAALPGPGILAAPSGYSFSGREPDRFIVESSTVKVVIGGEDFAYFGGRPRVQGTITDVKYFELDTLIYKLSDAKLALSTAATKQSAEQLAAKIFAKDDIVKGSSGNDYLRGFKKDDSLNGRAGDDSLVGDGGRDTLNGGDGADFLDGGKGKDTYVFKSAPETGVDTVLTFDKGDLVEFRGKAFSGLPEGPLEDRYFALGSVALDADDRILYDPGSGGLFYDADGAGGSAAVLVAALPVNLETFGAGNIIVA